MEFCVAQLTETELEEWQKEQLDRCLVENTINKLIETYEILEQSTDVRLYQERSHNLEESAILMAISEHGLHQNDDMHLLQVQQQQQQERRRILCGSSRMIPGCVADGNGDDNDPVDYVEADETSNDATSLLEAAVSVAIQKQGLGLLGPNR